MAKHARGSSFYKKMTAGIGVTAFAAVPVIVNSSISQAADCTSAITVTSATSNLTASISTLSSGVCEAIFELTDRSDDAGQIFDFTLNEEVEKIGAVLVGGGSGSSFVGGFGGYSGTGGQVVYSEMKELFGVGEQLTGYVGATSSETVIRNQSADQQVLLLTEQLEFDYSYEYAIDQRETGSSGTSLPVFTEIGELDFQVGAGTRDAAASSQTEYPLAGGLGVSMRDLVSLEPSLVSAELWPEGDAIAETVFGAGGSILEPGSLLPTDSPAGTGGYLIGGSSSTQLGAPGIIILRFTLPNTRAVYVASAPAYEGPLGVVTQLRAPINDSAVATGRRLNTIDRVNVGGVDVDFELLDNGDLKFDTPDLNPGEYPVRYGVGRSLTLTASITLTENKRVVTAGPSYLTSRLFANFRGDLFGVTAADSRAIRNFIESYDGITNVTCVGSTSGVPAIATDLALAAARAKNSCDLVQSLVPGVAVRELTSTGKGVGQDFRSVKIYIRGTN